MNKVTANTDHLEDVRAQLGSTDYDAIIAEAQQHQDAEHTLTLKQALRRYPKAVMWSVILSGAIIMEGFDLVLMSSLFAQPQFQRKYGVQLADGSYTIESQWQIGLNLAVQAGSIIGLTANGWASERFGYRKTILTALVMMIAVIFIPFFAQNIETLFAGQLLAGIPWGIFQTLTTAYASEVVPVALRPYLTAYVNLCWVIGQLIASGVLRGMLNWQAEWAFRVPFALQWVWPPLILVPCLFAPDSPWWLVRKGRFDQARNAVRRLRSNPTDEEVDQQIAFMQHTNALEKASAATGGTSYLQCFRGSDLRRTEVAVGAWICQNWCGSSFMGWSTYFLERAGLDTSNAFTMTIGQYALGAVGTIVSWWLMSYVGRRTLYVYGLAVLAGLLFIIGGLGFASRASMGASWAIGALLLIYTAVYDATVGPVCYAIVAECSSTRLRAKTIVIARIVYNIAGIINFIKMPYFLNADELDWGGKTGLYWGGLCTLCLIWTYFRCPEMKGRTYGELEVLFDAGVPARKFSSTHVDQFAGAHVSEGKKIAEESTGIENVESKKADGDFVQVSKA